MHVDVASHMLEYLVKDCFGFTCSCLVYGHV
jgi:hypothetical protein